MPVWLQNEGAWIALGISALFIVAGELMSRGGVGQRIITFSKELLGFMPGGLGMVVVGASMIFGGISGSAIADSRARCLPGAHYHRDLFC